MNPTWDDGSAPPEPLRPDLRGWLRVARRAGPLLALLAVCFPVLLLLRLPERAVWGARRPLTPWITQAVCIAACRLLGLRRVVSGRPAGGAVALVANHVGWIDIFVLNAGARITFVAKAEVRGWAGIGWLARGTGTLFIRRDRAEAAAQARLFAARLASGQRLLLFPEGTSSDGLRVLPFRSALFAAFLSPDLDPGLRLQPVTLRYSAPPGADRRHYAWWGDMEFGPSLLRILATPHRGRVEVIHHRALPARAAGDRKALARAAETAIRHGLATGLPLA